MSRDKAKKPTLIREVDGVQTLRDPKTGEEFSTTINRPIREAVRDRRLVTLKCKIRTDEGLTKQISLLRSVIGSDTTLNNRELLAEIRRKQTIAVAGLRIWRAEQIAKKLKNCGFSVEIVQR
jgi:hypothetical protein